MLYRVKYVWLNEIYFFLGCLEGYRILSGVFIYENFIMLKVFRIYIGEKRVFV